MNKTCFLLTALVIAFSTTAALAEISVQEVTSPEYLYNHGHSTLTVDMVQKSKAGANGEKYIPATQEEHQNEPKLVKWVRKFFIYMDPALDNDSFMQHDIKSSPSYEDL